MFDLTKLTEEDLHTRPSKVKVTDLGRVLRPGASIGDFIESLPLQFGAVELRYLRDQIVRCRRSQQPIGVAIGGHVIKVGVGSYLIDWIKQGVIQSISMNGSAAIHDFELAFAGHTSEDVGAQLAKGLFGMAKQTSEAFAAAAALGAKGPGLGHGLGAHMESLNCPHADSSVVLAAYRANIPCTIHVGIGTDIVHMNPRLSGADLGAAGLTDFQTICRVVYGMGEGLWLNIGSAVVMPEVFLKAIAIAKNLGADLTGLVTANLDKESKYRTKMNVLSRPSARGVEIIGHHEILVPLLHAAVAVQLANTEGGAKS